MTKEAYEHKDLYEQTKEAYELACSNIPEVKAIPSFIHNIDQWRRNVLPRLKIARAVSKRIPEVAQYFADPAA